MMWHSDFDSIFGCIRRKSADLVIGSVHDESHVTSQRTELADHQLVANEGEVVQHALRLELLRAFRIVVVAVITDHDIRVLDQRLEEPDLREALHRFWIIGRWSLHSRLHCSVHDFRQVTSDSPLVLMEALD